MRIGSCKILFRRCITNAFFSQWKLYDSIYQDFCSLATH